MAFEDRQKGRHAVLVADLELIAKDTFGAGCRDKTLVLNESAGEVDILPVRHVVEQEGKSRQRLPVDFFVGNGTAHEVFAEIDESHTEPIGHWFQEVPHQTFWHDAKQVCR